MLCDTSLRSTSLLPATQPRLGDKLASAFRPADLRQRPERTACVIVAKAPSFPPPSIDAEPSSAMPTLMSRSLQGSGSLMPCFLKWSSSWSKGTFGCFLWCLADSAAGAQSRATTATVNGTSWTCFIVMPCTPATRRDAAWCGGRRAALPGLATGAMHLKRIADSTLQHQKHTSCRQVAASRHHAGTASCCALAATWRCSRSLVHKTSPREVAQNDAVTRRHPSDFILRARARHQGS